MLTSHPRWVDEPSSAHVMLITKTLAATLHLGTERAVFALHVFTSWVATVGCAFGLLPLDVEITYPMLCSLYILFKLCQILYRYSFLLPFMIVSPVNSKYVQTKANTL
jgi:hypothetical protein